jgi:peptidyl-prolyl cis-trans isomerase A (cyclophilin A)
MPNRFVQITTNFGTFQVELFESQVPATTKNFVQLIERSYYDGTVFHRVIDGFMIQGGCPNGDGRGGPGYTIPDEFHSELRHDSEGILSMANAGPNTGGSQFFITLAATSWLDDKHAVFGKVVDGMKTVRRIGETTTGPGDVPIEAVAIESVRLLASSDASDD